MCLSSVHVYNISWILDLRQLALVLIALNWWTTDVAVSSQLSAYSGLLPTIDLVVQSVKESFTDHLDGLSKRQS